MPVLECCGPSKMRWRAPPALGGLGDEVFELSMQGRPAGPRLLGASHWIPHRGIKGADQPDAATDRTG